MGILGVAESLQTLELLIRFILLRIADNFLIHTVDEKLLRKENGDFLMYNGEGQLYINKIILEGCQVLYWQWFDRQARDY
jgi:hypothetical protein